MWNRLPDSRVEPATLSVQEHLSSVSYRASHSGQCTSPSSHCRPTEATVSQKEYRDIQVSLYFDVINASLKDTVALTIISIAVVSKALQLDDHTHLSPEAISFNMAAGGVVVTFRKA